VIAVASDQQESPALAVREDALRCNFAAGWKSLDTPDWAADGKGFYASGRANGDSVLLYIDLNGNASVLWRWPGEEEGLSDVYALPWPDGRHLAIFGWTSNSNMWMMENF
jgi:hypothetical protein